MCVCKCVSVFLRKTDITPQQRQKLAHRGDTVVLNVRSSGLVPVSDFEQKTGGWCLLWLFTPLNVKIEKGGFWQGNNKTNLQAQRSQNFHSKTFCFYSMILALSVKLLFVERTEEAFIGIPTQQKQKTATGHRTLAWWTVLGPVSYFGLRAKNSGCLLHMFTSRNIKMEKEGF